MQSGRLPSSSPWLLSFRWYSTGPCGRGELRTHKSDPGSLTCQDPSRQAAHPDDYRYLETPHLGLRRRHHRPDCPSRLVSLLRHYLRRYLRNMDSRQCRLLNHLWHRELFIRQSSGVDLLCYIRLLLGQSGHRQCLPNDLVGRSIWRMVLLWSAIGKWWCAQESYSQSIRQVY